jgi:hypothetical protein
MPRFSSGFLRATIEEMTKTTNDQPRKSEGAHVARD